jgi:hypothetical protein
MSAPGPSTAKAPDDGLLDEDKAPHLPGFA